MSASPAPTSCLGLWRRPGIGVINCHPELDAASRQEAIVILGAPEAAVEAEATAEEEELQERTLKFTGGADRKGELKCIKRNLGGP